MIQKTSSPDLDELYTIVLSANKQTFDFLSTLQRSLMNIRKSCGPRIDP